MWYAVGLSTWPCRGIPVPAETPGLGAARLGAVCHAVVLPADIFIGGRTTCNRLRGIRTERCFAHLYPRFTARPIQRQPSLPVLALSRLPSHSSPVLSRRSCLSFAFASLPPPGLPICGRYHCRRGAAKATEGCSSRRRAAGAGQRDDILAVGYQPPRRSSRCARR